MPLQLVATYLRDFTNKIDNRFIDDEVGSTQPLPYLMGDFVFKRNKRTVVFFITEGRPETSKLMTEVTYTMPVEAEGSPLFGGTGDEVLPPGDDQPSFFDYPIPPGKSVTELVAEKAEARGLAPWMGEITRLRALKETETDKAKITAIKNILHYWTRMRPKMFDALYYGDVRIRRTASGRSGTPSPKKTSSRRRTTPASEPARLKSSQTRKRRTTSDPR